MSNLDRRERLAAKLRKYSADNNLSGAELGLKLDVSQQSAHRYLSAATYPSEETRRRIAKLLGITYEELRAELDGVTLASKLPPDQLAREVRLLSDAEFNQHLLPVFLDRVSAQLSPKPSQKRQR